MELASDAVAVCCVAFCTLSPSLCRRCGTWHCNRNHNRAIESQAAPDHFTLPERFAVSASAGTNGDTSVCRKFLDCAPVGHGQQQGGAQSQEGSDASSSDREYMQMAATPAPAAAAAAAAATTVPAPPPADANVRRRREHRSSVDSPAGGLCATLFGSPPPPPPPPPAYGQAPVAQNPMYQAPPPPYNG